ncbi:type II secretion system protein GspN [Thermovibrio sp.]
MRKLLYGLLFIFLTLLFTYLTFPFDRLISSKLCGRVSYKSLSFSRFPLKITLYGLKLPNLNLKVDYLELSPSLLSLVRGKKEFFFKGSACKGTFEGESTYPLSKLTFNLSGIDLSCPLNSAEGKLSGKGELLFKGRDIVAGEGEFKVSKLKLLNLNFGLFKFGSLSLGDLKANYTVKRKNLIKVKAESFGKDASLKVKGEVFYTPLAPLNSYVNLIVKVKVNKEPFNGKEFSFSIRGNLRNLGI